MYISDVRGFSCEVGVDIFTLPFVSLKCAAAALSELDYCLFLSLEDEIVVGTKTRRKFLKLFPYAEHICTASKISIHGMGLCGARGIIPYLAKLFISREIDFRYLTVSDMCISFFVNDSDGNDALAFLEEVFPLSL